MKAVLVISERDNVGTALESLETGRRFKVGSETVVARHAIPRGHKIAVRAIASGEPVVKYGSAIGIAIADIPAGAHVHTHNLSSSRGRGDLARPERAASEGRLAEPPDDGAGVAEDQAAVPGESE
jgi:altronate hydrolase